ncbi:MAG: hypothetical protein QOF02_2867, partial [Blastocatellia bacterium]|nr:hypothetical protein [Blastocatellia bacterium]
MKRRTGVSLSGMLCCVIAITIFQPAAEARGQENRLQGRAITGIVYFIGGSRGGVSRPFTLNINTLTSPEETQRLNAA